MGYRKYALLKARDHKIIGWARNLATRQVEVFAQSEDPMAMDFFIRALKDGPPRSKVDSVDIIDVDSIHANCNTFTIEPDGERPSEF